MNEYQDQSVWFEVQVRQGVKWVTVSDHDTREEAESAKDRLPYGTARVRRTWGLT